MTSASTVALSAACAADSASAQTPGPDSSIFDLHALQISATPPASSRVVLEAVFCVRLADQNRNAFMRDWRSRRRPAGGKGKRK